MKDAPYIWVKNLGNTRDEAEPPPQQDAACDVCENKSAAPRTRPLSTCLTQVEEVLMFTSNYRFNYGSVTVNGVKSLTPGFNASPSVVFVSPLTISLIFISFTPLFSCSVFRVHVPSP